MEEQISLNLIAILTLMLFVLANIVSVWQWVGVRRSASNYETCGGWRGWAIAAKIGVVLGILTGISSIFNSYIPQSAEMFRILAGDTSIPSYKMEILPGRAEVEFRGGLRAGCAKDFEKVLSSAPQVKVLHIESIGGRLIEAEAMMKVVRDRQLVTYTSERCLSAATLVLIAGDERMVEENAKVGFHSGTFPGITREQIQDMNEIIRTAMQSAGISESFINHVISTPADQMWYPTYQEMRDAGVITGKMPAANHPVALP